MTILRNNVISNFGGQAVTMLLGLVFMPVYVKILGIEAYGLIGFFITLQVLFSILDMGLSATLSRQLAQYGQLAVDSDQQRDLVVTLEWVYWPTAVFIALVVFAMSAPIANHWLQPVTLSPAQTAHAITIMGVATALQWPSALYSGGFRGLERQVVLNVINVCAATLRAIGSLIILVYISPSLEAFLWWQAASGALQSTVSRWVLWRILPRGTRRANFSLETLYTIRRFALGMAGIATLSFLLVQSDRILLSALLPLDEFGYYTVAATVSAALLGLVAPFFNGLFPRYSALVSAGSEAELANLYHQSNQYLAVIVCSVAAVLALFSNQFLLLWTRDPILAAASGPVLSLLVIGTAANGLLHLPYALQLAYGWTRLALYQNLVAVLIAVPAIWLLAHLYGAIGAACVWIALNVGFLTISIPVMHRRLLRNEAANWYLRDILPPLAAATATAGTAKLVMTTFPDGALGFATLAFVGLATLCFAGFASPSVRNMLRRQRVASQLGERSGR